MREGVLWAAEGSSCQLISLDCMQAAYRGTYPSPGVCETPARCGCLPELVHPGGHQRKEVRALGPGEVPDRRAWASYLFSSCGSCIHHGGRSRETECLNFESACGGPFSGKGSPWWLGSERLEVGNSLSSNTWTSLLMLPSLFEFTSKALALLLVGCGHRERAFLVTHCGDLGEWDSFPRGGVEPHLQGHCGYLTRVCTKPCS